MNEKIFYKTLILLLLITNLKAQTKINNLFVDGNYNFVQKNSSFSNINFSNPKQTKFGFSTNIGYQLNKSFIVGLGFNYQQEKISSLEYTGFSFEDESVRIILVDEQITPSLFFSYLKSINSKLILGLRTNIGYSYDNYIIQIQPNNLNHITSVTKNYNLNLNISPLIQLFLINKLGIQFSYTLFNRDFDFNRNPSDFKLGLFYYFGKK